MNSGFVRSGLCDSRLANLGTLGAVSRGGVKILDSGLDILDMGFKGHLYTITVQLINHRRVAHN